MINKDIKILFALVICISTNNVARVVQIIVFNKVKIINIDLLEIEVLNISK